MCGIAGMMLAPRERNFRERARIVDNVERLMLLSEERGSHAAGIAVLSETGYELEKRAGTPYDFLDGGVLDRVIGDPGPEVRLIMAHTRYATAGDRRDPRNAHPFQVGPVVGMHNGSIRNADALAHHHGIRRRSDTDSELLVHLAERSTYAGRIEVDSFLGRLESCYGEMSLVAASVEDPDRVVIVKGNKPLAFARSQQLEAVAFASKPEYLRYALDEADGWRPFKVPWMEAVVYDMGTRVRRVARRPVRFGMANSRTAWR